MRTQISFKRGAPFSKEHYHGTTKIDWARHLTAYESSGLKLSDYCAEAGLSPTTFKYHRYKRPKREQGEEAIEQPINGVRCVAAGLFLTLCISVSCKPSFLKNRQLSEKDAADSSTEIPDLDSLMQNARENLPLVSCYGGFRYGHGIIFF